MIEAEQFESDKKPWPSGVAEMTLPSGGTIAVINGTTLKKCVQVFDCDWIITNAEGHRHRLEPAEWPAFEAGYERVADA